MTQGISRRTTLMGLGAAALGAAMTEPARAQATPVRVGIIPISTNAPFYAADKLGYFAAENLAVTSQVIRGGAAAIPAMLSGTTDIVFSNATSVVEAMVRGIDLRLILEGTIAPSRPPDSGAIVKRKGEPLRTGKDLEGKIVAVNTLRDVIWMIVRAWITATGGDVAKVQIVEVPLPAVAEALRQKRVDAALIIDPSLTVALEDPGLELLDWPMSKVYSGGPMAFFIVTGDLAARRPNDIRAFVRAYKRGAAWVVANQGKDAYYNLVAEFSGLNVDLVRRMKPVAVQSDIVPASLPRLTALMRQTGLLETDLDLRTKVFT
jgi:NitT/TauT family transport system substrate-binding protein